MITRVTGVLLDPDDARYLADLLDHLCRTTRPSARLTHLAGRLRKSCASLTSTQENGPNHLRDVHIEADPSDHRPYDLLDTDEAARLLGITPAGVRDLIRRGRLTAHRAGRGYLLPARLVVERADRKAARRAG